MKKALNYIFYFLLLMRAGNLYSQTAVIPDPNFRQFLKTYYPGTMNINDELITSNAAAVTGTIQCSGRNIENLEGIQYFTGITTLYCYNNKLTTLPDLSGITNLIMLHAHQNLISSLPSFNELTNLKILILGDNQLKNFPVIDSLKNLTELFIYGNELTAIPDLVHLPKLKKLHCYRNKITSIGAMPATLLDLVFYHNLITQFPDISLATGLVYIGGHENSLASIPNLSSYASLVTCALHNNRLSFEDLIPSSTHPSFSQWTIHPQDSFLVTREHRLLKKENLTINVHIDSALSDLTYSWYQNGSLREQTTKPILEISSVEESDGGTYYCKVSSSNPAFSFITLTSQTFTILPLPDFTVEEDLTITPNGDGKNDELYLEEKGKLCVYDSKGKLLDQLQAPCYWNGSTKDGIELGTGFYLLRVGETVYRITVIR